LPVAFIRKSFKEAAPITPFSSRNDYRWQTRRIVTVAFALKLEARNQQFHYDMYVKKKMKHRF